MTYDRIETKYPGWENSFRYPNRRFERYIKQKRRGKAGSTSETVKIAIAVFDFLKKKYIETPRHTVPEELIRRNPTNDEIGQYIVETYGTDPEAYGWVRTMDIIEAISPPHRRLGSDSAEREYPHRHKTLVYRVLAEMTELYLIQREEASWKTVYYRLVWDASGEDLDLTKEELLKKYHDTMVATFLQADRYRAAIDIMKSYGIPHPEQQVQALIDKGDNPLHTSHKCAAEFYSDILASRRGRVLPESQKE
ncbi:MAG: hypothetical protein GX837_06630 [Methanomicrobiales archaeon]|nr:hypothetical protein [Methanomicrobiales archaeon]